jgi:DNA-binding NarL/FixJ family response regulator
VTPTTRVLLADDHALVRVGIRSLLSTIVGFDVVGEAGTGHEVVELAGKLRPHVVLMDIAMPGLNGLDATARIVERHPGMRVIILSMHAGEEYALQALRAGAAGYLLKDADLLELERAIVAVARGETYLSPAISKHVIADYRRRVAEQPEPIDRLTPRQREVLRLIAEGLSTKEIAFKLSLSVKTVETHRAQLMERLEIRDVAGLVRFAVRSGLVDPGA